MIGILLILVGIGSYYVTSRILAASKIRAKTNQPPKPDTKPEMKQLTINDLKAIKRYSDRMREFNPDALFDKNWSVDALDILSDERIEPITRLALVFESDLVTNRLKRLFAIWCVRQIVTSDTDPKTLSALKFAESYAENYDLVDDPDYRAMWENERLEAWVDAKCACELACEAAHAAGLAAHNAAVSDTKYVDFDAWLAVREAASAEYDAKHAAESAACSASRLIYNLAASTSHSTTDLAMNAAISTYTSSPVDSQSAVRSAQISTLKKMIIEGIQTGDVK